VVGSPCARLVANTTNNAALSSEKPNKKRIKVFFFLKCDCPEAALRRRTRCHFASQFSSQAEVDDEISMRAKGFVGKCGKFQAPN